MITILQLPKRRQESLGYKNNQFILILAVLEERESSIQNSFFSSAPTKAFECVVIGSGQRAETSALSNSKIQRTTSTCYFSSYYPEIFFYSLYKI